MPVLIAAHGTDLDLVRPLARRLREDGGEVRCYLDTDDQDLRVLGCKIAIGALDDAYTLEAALTNVHTFVPVLMDPFAVNDGADLAALRATGVAAAEAAAASDLAQTILPVPLLPEGHPIQAVLGEIEQSFETGVRPLCLLRTGYLWGEGRPFPAALAAAKAAGAELDPGVCVCVVERPTWASVIAAADDREGVQGAWDLGGDVQPLVDLLDRVGGAGASAPPSAWSLALLAGDLVLGSSAAQEFVSSQGSGVPQVP